METLKFKTNIQCSGCIAAVTPALNNIIEISRWEVDTENPKKVLTVHGERLMATDIINALTKAGYTAEPILK